MSGGSVLQFPTVDELLARLDELEQQLHSMNAELAQLHRLSVLGVLAAGIAHEINNLLTPVLSYAQLALAKPEDQELRTRAIERTQAGIESVAKIVHAILGLARGEDDENTANVADVLDETLRCLGTDPAKQGIDLVVDVPAETWVAIKPIVLQQVMLNLLLNSLKAMHGQRGTISISAISHGSRTEIIVADDGPGIPADVLSTIFEPPTRRPTSARKRRSQPLVAGHCGPKSGTGVGLSICKQLISAADGSIKCTSSPDDGAIFTIVLPKIANMVRKAG